MSIFIYLKLPTLEENPNPNQNRNTNACTGCVGYRGTGRVGCQLIMSIVAGHLFTGSQPFCIPCNKLEHGSSDSH